MSFKDFVLKGNVMDLAIGVIMGGAFGKIVDSLVADVINPLLAAIIGKPDFSSIFVKLSDAPATYAGPATYEALKKGGANLLGIGAFATVVINFLILAFVIYMLVKYTQRLTDKMNLAAPPPTDEVVLLREIRDNLKK